MSIRSNMQQATKILENIKNYDANNFSLELLLWLRELDFFYRVGRKTPMPLG